MSTIMRNIPLGTPPPEQLKLIGRRFRYAPGTPLIVAGRRPTCVLLLDEGRVKVVLPHSDSRQTILAVRAAGTVLGSTAALTRTPHGASVVTLDKCVIYRVGTLRLHNLVERDRKTWWAWLIDDHARRIAEADQRTAAFHLQSVGSRLARQLLAWAAQFGVPAPEGGVAVVGLTRRELADSICASEKTVDQVLGRMCCAFLINTSWRRFHIPDPDKLAAAAEAGL